MPGHRKRELVILIVAIGGAAMVLLGVLGIVLRGKIHAAALATLQERFASDVDVKDIRIRLFPHVGLVARGVTLRYHKRTDIPPLMTIEEISMSANPLLLLGSTKHVRSVSLTGLQVHIPPKEDRVQTSAPLSKKVPRVLIDEVETYDSYVEIGTKKPGKQPLMFMIHRLLFHSFSFDQPTSFEAALTNPKPIGEIDSTGHFGPWVRDDPGETPVFGNFNFSDADLSTVGGVVGILASMGQYRGVLDRLDVTGDTDTPDFGLKAGKHRVHLTSHYVAVVDGTNGDTELKSVQAHFLHSNFLVSGTIDGIPPQPGKRVTLEGSAKNARIEDVLRLVMKSDQPPLSGDLTFQSRIEVKNGPGKMLQKLSLDGMFGIAKTRFDEAKVQNKIDALSRAGQGEPKDQDIADMVSNLSGRFSLRNGIATIRGLNFDVQGAKVAMNGSYDLRSEALDFHGHLLLDAKLSHATTGVKSFLLKAVDPFVKGKNGGTSLPIKVEGTREDPKFGLDFGHKTEQARESDQ